MSGTSTFWWAAQWLVSILIVSITTYLLLYRNKLNKLQPSAQRCFHINKMPFVSTLIPRFILFALCKPKGTPLRYCQLEIPGQKNTPQQSQIQKTKRQNEALRGRQVYTVHASTAVSKAEVDGDESESEEKEIYNYFSQIEVMVDAVRIDVSHLDAYNRLFDIAPDASSSSIAIGYAHAIYFPLLPYLVSMDEFPVSPLGLTLIGTELSLYEPLSTRHCYEITTSLTQIRGCKKGVEIDLTTNVYVQVANNATRLVYCSVQTLLSPDRGKMQRCKQNERNDAVSTKRRDAWKIEFDPKHSGNRHNIVTQTQVNVRADIGLRYGNIIGDASPYHMNRWSAMMMGYWQPIVHGMWSLQKCLAEIEKIYASHTSLNPNQRPLFLQTYPLRVVCSYKRPLSMPSTVQLISNYYAHTNDYLTFALVSDDQDTPYVFGSIVPESFNG